MTEVHSLCARAGTTVREYAMRSDARLCRRRVCRECMYVTHYQRTFPTPLSKPRKKQFMPLSTMLSASIQHTLQLTHRGQTTAQFGRHAATATATRAGAKRK